MAPTYKNIVQNPKQKPIVKILKTLFTSLSFNIVISMSSSLGGVNARAKISLGDLSRFKRLISKTVFSNDWLLNKH